MELPGGLFYNGHLQRDLSFKPITGALERIIAESGLEESSLAEQVTIILSNALDIIAGLPADEKRVRLLSSGDRQFLIHQLEAIIAPSPKWLTSVCQTCDELIQFQFVPGTLPVKSAGKEFPSTSLSLSIGDVCVRVLTGEDEEIIAQVKDQDSAIDLMLKRLLFSHKGQQGYQDNQEDSLDINTLTKSDREMVDQTLDEMSPQPGHSANMNCPYCHHPQVIEIDSYDWITRETHGLDEEIHLIAFNYHWSEKEILALPRQRRKYYIQLIEKNLGSYHTEDLVPSMNKGIML